MFWSYVLPAQIALGLIAIVVVLITWRTPRWEVDKGYKFSFTAGLGALAFLPCCVAIDTVIAPARFRVFEYQDYASVNNAHVLGYLPPGATQIVVSNERNGYRAKFTISEFDLQQWHKGARDSMIAAGSYNAAGGHSVGMPSQAEIKSLSRRFETLEWSEPRDPLLYIGPYEHDWGGSTVLYDRATSTAYQLTADW